MATKLIPASDLQVGYIMILPDGSSRVVASPPIITVVVTLDTGEALGFQYGEQVTVEAETGEF
jgi:hypothetical protein